VLITIIIARKFENASSVSATGRIEKVSDQLMLAAI
jgi:hypothetical protein